MGHRITLVYFNDGISSLGGRKGMSLVPKPMVPHAESIEPSGHGLLIKFNGQLVLIPWSKVESCEVEEVEAEPKAEEPEEPKPRRGRPPNAPKAVA